jgi:hypothetical protein
MERLLNVNFSSSNNFGLIASVAEPSLDRLPNCFKMLRQIFFYPRFTAYAVVIKDNPKAADVKRQIDAALS